jgi:aminopeptidase N
MESPGIVLFNSNYVFKETVEYAHYCRFATTLSHELSHHWFGDLVTMNWWNDLWLNESFAEFISSYCLSKIEIQSIPIKNVWESFLMRKNAGYIADAKSTTHPISSLILNTYQASTVNIFS